ncbi:alpha/beta fold hydrolase [bacterium]|nr:alpha/beta fold hydrolase [bacterium]
MNETGSPEAPASEEAVNPCPRPASLSKALEDFDRTAEVRVIETPYYRTTCRIIGEGPPLLVSPGLASTYRGFALFLNTLAERFRTIIYDYPGDNPDDRANLGRIDHDALTDNLFATLDGLGIGKAFLVGISFGSTLTFKALARDARRFPKAAVQGAFARRKFSPAERVALKLGRIVPGSVGRLPLHEKILTYNNRIHFPQEIDDRWRHYLRENAKTPIRSLAHRLDLVAGLDIRPALPEIRTPILLIQGNEDRIVPRPYFDELQQSLPEAQGLIVPMVGHQPHYTHPEALAQAIANYLLGCEEHAECSQHVAESSGQDSRTGG